MMHDLGSRHPLRRQGFLNFIIRRSLLNFTICMPRSINFNFTICMPRSDNLLNFAIDLLNFAIDVPRRNNLTSTSRWSRWKLCWIRQHLCPRPNRQLCWSRAGGRIWRRSRRWRRNRQLCWNWQHLCPRPDRRWHNDDCLMLHRPSRYDSANLRSCRRSRLQFRGSLRFGFANQSIRARIPCNQIFT